MFIALCYNFGVGHTLTQNVLLWIKHSFLPDYKIKLCPPPHHPHPICECASVYVFFGIWIQLHPLSRVCARLRKVNSPKTNWQNELIEWLTGMGNEITKPIRKNKYAMEKFHLENETKQQAKNAIQKWQQPHTHTHTQKKKNAYFLNEDEEESRGRGREERSGVRNTFHICIHFNINKTIASCENKTNSFFSFLVSFQFDVFFAQTTITCGFNFPYNLLYDTKWREQQTKWNVWVTNEWYGR